MPLLKRYLKSEIGVAFSSVTVKLNALLTKIAAASAEKASRLQILKGSNLWYGDRLVSFSINPTGDPALTFDAGPNYGTVAAHVAIQDLTYTAKTKGTGGNAITVAYTTGGTAGSEVVSVVGNAISVQIETGVSTATQVKAAVDAFAAAAALVSVAVTGTGSNAQTAPVSATHLASGSNTRTYAHSDIYYIKRLRTRKYKIVIKGSAAN